MEVEGAKVSDLRGRGDNKTLANLWAGAITSPPTSLTTTGVGNIEVEEPLGQMKNLNMDPSPARLNPDIDPEVHPDKGYEYRDLRPAHDDSASLTCIACAQLSGSTPRETMACRSVANTLSCTSP